MERLAICAIFKNEAPYLLEWIDYHRRVGFDHFVLYDNDSTDDGAARILASEHAPHVEIIPWPPRPGPWRAGPAVGTGRRALGRSSWELRMAVKSSTRLCRRKSI